MPKTIIEEYIEILDAIYGVYLDGIQGFSSAKKLFENAQKGTLARNIELEKNKPNDSSAVYNLSIEEFDNSSFIYTKGTKGKPNYRILHYCSTQAQYKERNSPDGENYRFIGNMALISIYEYWQNSCRNKLAKHHEVNSDKVVSPIFGDLRLLRHSIVHHKGIALSNVERCLIFTWFKADDDIFINDDKMEDIVATIKRSKSNLYTIGSA